MFEKSNLVFCISLIEIDKSFIDNYQSFRTALPSDDAGSVFHVRL